MGKFFAELKRRHVYRVGAAYAVIAWLLLQLFNNVTPILEAPPWVGRVLLLLLVVGFPIALLLAWTFEATLAGIKRESALPAGVAPPLHHSWIDWVLAGALVVVIGLVSYEQLAPSRGTNEAQGIGPNGPQNQAGTISIAVLPLANLSGDASQEFFSDGMTDEIITALTKVTALRVVGRESAYQYKGQKTDMRAVGQALGASYLIAGSVRKDGDRVRISAQLTRADTGVNLWAESYDRELKDIFATQSDIAQAIAGALKVPLGLQQGESLVANRTSDVDSYQQYLRARALFRARSYDDVIAILEPVVARDPDYAPAWALLSFAYSNAPFDTPAARRGTIEEARRITQSFQAKAEMAARTALRLDPKYAGAYWALGRIEGDRNNWVGADDFMRQALKLDPNDPDILNAYRATMDIVGRLKEGLRTAQLVEMLEPFVPGYKLSLASGLLRDGQNAAAIKILEALPAGGALSYARNTALARAYAVEGRYSQAADTLLAIEGDDIMSRPLLEQAARLLRTAPTKVAAPETLPALPNAGLNFVYAHVGAFERIFEVAERNLAVDAAASGSLWYPDLAPLRKTQRFKDYARRAGWVDYWKARGWPDLCKPQGADDFTCE